MHGVGRKFGDGGSLGEGRIVVGALLVVGGSLAEILDLGGKRKEALP